MEGCEVMPLMLSMQASIMSAPASAAAIWVATPVPAESWVWTWMARSGNCFLQAGQNGMVMWVFEDVWLRLQTACAGAA